jgi:hypothetical protein
MRGITIITSTLLALTSGYVSAQDAQPYSGLETREIKALSDEQIADLRAGRGMGFALAAELNGYPGPRHVIDLAEPLGLTDGQLAEVQALFVRMQAETIPIGERLILLEAALDRLFREQTITPAGLEQPTRAIGETEAELRAAHLKYHLSTMAALSPEQIGRYKALRGYAASGAPNQQHDGHLGTH